MTTIDYLMIVLKSTENRLGAQKAIYDKIHQMYAQDITERVCASFTFSDGAKPVAAMQLDMCGIKIHESKHYPVNN